MPLQQIAAILHTFVEDFVNGLLIADYKQLETSNNPYRYRRHISALRYPTRLGLSELR
jgi:hypothetical protein